MAYKSKFMKALAKGDYDVAPMRDEKDQTFPEVSSGEYKSDFMREKYARQEREAIQRTFPQAVTSQNSAKAENSLTVNRYRAQKDSDITLMGKATSTSPTQSRYQAQKGSTAKLVEGSEIPAKLNKLKELKAQRADEEQPGRGGVNEQYTQLYEEMKRRYGDQVDDWLEAQERGEFTAGGGFGSNEEKHAAKRPWYETVFDTVGRGAGQFNQGIASTLDFAANAIPRVEGAVFGTDPEGTLTGQLLKPVTDATGKLKDWVDENTTVLDKAIAEDTEDSRAAQLATELGSGVVSALPNSILAILTSGASTAETLAPHAEGFVNTVANAARTVLKNPMFQTSAAQSLGSSYDEAKEAGASDAAAMSAATISTLLNSLVEVGGGVETLPGELQNADLSTGEKVLEWVKSALDEGKEEVVQGVISALSNKVASGSDSPYVSTTDDSAVINPLRMAQEGAMGAAVGGILGGGQLLTNTLANRAGKAVTVDDVMPKVNGAEQIDTGGEAAVAKSVDMILAENGQLNIDNTNTGTYTESRSTGGAKNGTELDGDSGTGVWGRPDSGATDSSLAGRVPANGQGNLSDSGIVLLSPESQQTLTERGIVNVELHDSSADNAAFSSALDAARAVDSQNGWAVTPKTPEELAQAGAKSYMDKNGSTGFAIAPDGDIEAVFANKAAGAPKGATKSTMPQAIALGGDKLDCYGSNLVDIYSRYGFEPVARVKANAEYANPGWTAEKGSPDIYFMVHNGDSADTVVQNMGTYKAWSRAELESLPVMEYDEAYEYRDALLNRRKGRNITVDDVMPKVGDMGAKTSDFDHEVKESRGKTLPDYYEANNIPEEARADNHYTAVTEKESLHNAKSRLEQDYEGEVAELYTKNDWNNEEMDMSWMILGDLEKEARKSGDWSEFTDWAKLDQDRGGDAARALQSRAKRNRNTALGILTTAAQTVETARPGIDTNAVMQTVSNLTERYEAANDAQSVAELVQIIKDTAAERKTGFKKLENRSKIVRSVLEKHPKLQWLADPELKLALKRITKYAKAEVSNLDTKAEVSEPVLRTNYEVKVGDAVRVTDRNNFGHITAIDDEAGTYTVHFKSETGAEATKTFTGDMIAKLGRRTTVQSIDTGKSSTPFYSFLQEFAARGIEAMAADTQKVDAAEAILTIGRNAKLSKKSTVLRNLVANNVFDPVDSISNDISVPLDLLLSQFTKTRSTAVDLSWISKTKRKSSLDSLAMGVLSVGLDVDASAPTGKFETTNSVRTFHMNNGQLEAGASKGQQAAHKAAGLTMQTISQWEKYNGYLLNATDEFQKGGIEAETQRGIDKLHEKKLIADDSLFDAGEQEAKYRTFQKDSQPAKMVQKLRDAGNVISYNGHSLHLGDAAIPFAQVPANLPAVLVDYSPVGLARGIVEIGGVLKSAKKGTLTAAQQRTAVKNVGRGINGSMLIAAAAVLSLKGIITVQAAGGEDENANKAASDKTKNLYGTQWNQDALERWVKGESTDFQKGDELISISYLEPFNGHMTMGALIADDIKADELTLKRVLQRSFEGTLQAFLDLPGMDALSSAVDAFRYSDADTEGGKFADAGEQFLADTAAGFIPNSWRGIAQGLDTYQRDLYTGDSTWERLKDQFKAVFDRDSLPIKQDVYGNDVVNEDRLQTFLNSNIRPGSVAQYTETDLQKALDALHEETGSYSMYLSKKAPNRVTVDDESIELSDEQKRQYMSVRGDAYEEASYALEENETFQGFSGGWKEKAYNNAKSYAQERAKEELGIGYEADDWIQELQDASPEEIADAVIQRTVESLAKKQGTDKYDGLGNMLEDGSINEEVAISLLPDSTFEKWEEYGEQYKVPVGTLMDVISYGNSDESNGEKNARGKAIKGQTHQDKMKKFINSIGGLSTSQKRGLWKIAVSDKGDCPW